jgi:outer membrane protein
MISSCVLLRRAAIALAAAFFTMPCRAQDSLTVDAVVERVLAQHPSIARAEAIVRSAEGHRGQVESYLLPGLNFDGKYSRIGPVPSLSVPGMGTFSLYPEDNYDVHIAGSYVLFDFGKARSAVNLADAGVQTARDQVELSKTDLAFETINSFFTVVLLRRSLQVADEELSVLADHMKIVKAKVETGSATALDSLNVAVRIAGIRVQRAELANRLEREETHLRQLMGVPDSTSLLLRAVLETRTVPTNIDSLMELARAQRPDVRVSQDVVNAAELQHTVARSGMLPWLQVSGLFGARNGYVPDLEAIKANWSVGLEVGVPVFDGNKTSYADEEARALVDATQARQAELMRRVRTEVVSGCSDLRTAWTKVDISEAEVRQAVAAMAIAATKFESGTATNVEVLDAQTAETTAKLHRLQALYSYVLSRYALERAIGGALYPTETIKGY